MKKEHLLEVLEKELEKQLKEFDFAIDWHPKKHQFEVIVVLFAENKDQESIEDEEGIVSEEEVIEFEDTVLFYTNPQDEIDKEEYLTTILFDRKKGLSKEWIRVFAKHLNDCLTEGQSDLLDFLSDESQEVFELNWNEEEFSKQTVAINNNTWVSYPKY
ncbi:DUF3013 family protein [Vagococcus hydrophili]|uniref:DUF3013 family protein n=1 Tax=Vagococcus hydrophili TaxID=2714947 RepID=A0A6G8ARZ6_9ENTE|nr:DUF3013 family protein [Vagococcus hydrophili]QIL47695.1 DUF3013 family protein [Vagococcus hydrophili]